MAGHPLLAWLNGTPFCIYTASFLSIHLLMGFWVVPCLGCYNAVIPYWNPIFISCRFVLRSGIAWSCGRPIFNFSKNLHIVFHSHQQCVTTFHHILTSACWFLFSWGWPFWHMKVKVTQLCLTLCDPMDYTVHGILQARILEWVAYLFSSGSSRPRHLTGSPALQEDSLPTELFIRHHQMP